MLYYVIFSASFIAVVDGAINAIHQSSPEKAPTIIPHLITGDFDSAEPDILNYYRQKVRVNQRL